MCASVGELTVCVCICNDLINDGADVCGLPSVAPCAVCLFVYFNLFNLPAAALCLTGTDIQYDRALLNLQVSTNALLIRNGSHYTPPPILSSIPGYLRRWPCSLPAWRRRRCRGKRGGTAVKLRLVLLKHRERFCSDEVFEGCVVFAGTCWIRFGSG